MPEFESLATGNFNVKTAPSQAGWLVAAMLPPIVSITLRASDKPKPVPRRPLLVKNGSKFAPDSRPRYQLPGHKPSPLRYPVRPLIGREWYRPAASHRSRLRE